MTGRQRPRVTARQRPRVTGRRNPGVIARQRSGAVALRLRSGAVAALCAVALLLAGCGATPEAPATTGAAPPAITVVTVPGPSTPGAEPVRTGLPEGGVILDPTGSVGVDPTRTNDPARNTAPTTATGDAETSGGGATMQSTQPMSSRTPVPPRNPSASSSPPSSAVSSAESTTVAVDLSACAGCQVIGVATEVQPGLAASLATAPQGAVLLATRVDGTVAGVSNVPYGVSFPAPAGGVLPCDRSGRCFVQAVQSGGTGVISVFQLAATGGWRDVTASGGFASATATALVADVDGDGVLDIALQADAGGALRWVVYHWAGDRFAVLGCVAASQGEPDDADVSLSGCS